MSTHKRLNKLCYIHSMEYQSAKKWHKTLIHIIWINLNYIIPSKNVRHKGVHGIYCLSPFVWNSKTDKLIYGERKHSGLGIIWVRHKGFRWGEGKNVLFLDSGVVYKAICNFQNSSNSTLKTNLFHCIKYASIKKWR